jgi:hypothetical protein
MIKMFWKIERFDKKLGLIESKANISRSLLRAFCSMLYTSMAEANTTYKETDMAGVGNITLTINAKTRFAVIACDGYSYVHGYDLGSYKGDEVGIVIGTGTTGVTPQETLLNVQINHGTDTGEMLYLGGLTYNAVVSGIYSYFDTMRMFENKSGGSITVKELGIAALFGNDSILICRDVLDALDYVQVNNNEYLKITYRMRVST